MTVSWAARAFRDYDQAIAQLQSAEPVAAVRLQRQVTAIISHVERFPNAYPRVRSRAFGLVRKAVIPRYRYALIFKVTDTENALIVAFWHGRRRPRTWDVP